MCVCVRVSYIIYIILYYIYMSDSRDILGDQNDLTLVRSWLMLVLPWHAACHGFGLSKSQVEVTAQDRYPSHLLPHPHTKITCLVKLGVAVLQGAK